MKLKYLDEHTIEKNGVELRLGYAYEGDSFYKVIEVTFLNIDKSYYFFETDLLDSLEDDSIYYINYKVINPNEPINPNVIDLAIDYARQLNDIKLIDITPDVYEKTDDLNWFRSYKVETSLGSVCVGFGMLNSVRNVLNCLYGWPYGVVCNTLKIIDTEERYEIKKGLLFSIIGFDILLNKSAPNCAYINPMKIEYKKAS
jgi:hypothetical protein